MNEQNKSVPVCIKISQSSRQMMLDLVEKISQELGIRVSKSQAMEIAIKEAFEKRKNG